MNPPMSWFRVWRIIRHVRANGLHYTQGQVKYLHSQLAQMNLYQTARFHQECSDILSRQGVTT
jgi:hypothetical protein